MYVTLTEAYGPFRKHDRKIVIKEGKDYYVLRSKGTAYHVPKDTCERS